MEIYWKDLCWRKGFTTKPWRALVQLGGWKSHVTWVLNSAILWPSVSVSLTMAWFAAHGEGHSPWRLLGFTMLWLLPSKKSGLFFLFCFLGKDSDWLNLCQVFIHWLGDKVLWEHASSPSPPTIAMWWWAKMLQENGMALRNIPDVFLLLWWPYTCSWDH